jgi:hypothetical protein
MPAGRDIMNAVLEHNKSDEWASQRRKPDGLERLKREGAASSNVLKG